MACGVGRPARRRLMGKRQFTMSAGTRAVGGTCSPAEKCPGGIFRNEAPMTLGRGTPRSPTLSSIGAGIGKQIAVAVPGQGAPLRLRLRLSCEAWDMVEVEWFRHYAGYHEISSERGPSNAAMGESAEERPWWGDPLRCLRRW
ncbi:MAG: hypothetical protein KatS3mg111_1428 [Pirellulaceae bacterium]|nr:MAG: hypothetical protein KatS3mg111_1428 [Pirellulaceae bacterium]